MARKKTAAGTASGASGGDARKTLYVKVQYFGIFVPGPCFCNISIITIEHEFNIAFETKCHPVFTKFIPDKMLNNLFDN